MTALVGEEIAIDWAYIRDTIKVNDAMLAEIRAELAFRALPPTATLALVAREIVHDPGYVLTGLTGHPLVLVAETYRGNGGAIEANGAQGPSGSPGPTGKSGQGQSGRAGGPGGLGGNGRPGLPGSPVTVMAAHLSDLRISARGGRGGTGGSGGAPAATATMPPRGPTSRTSTRRSRAPAGTAARAVSDRWAAPGRSSSSSP